MTAPQAQVGHFDVAPAFKNFLNISTYLGGILARASPWDAGESHPMHLMNPS